MGDGADEDRADAAAQPQGAASPFDAIRQEDADGNEWWSARALASILGYPRWQKFQPVVDRAMVACETSGYAPSDHFTLTGNMIATGKGAHRSVEDVRLSRYACYLVVQNADPEKPVVALGQTYFAVQTRRQELADETNLLAGMNEDQRRIYTRAQLSAHNRQLADAAADAGVVTPRDFAIFQDHGYMGLYNGERARDIAARKGLKSGQPILDHMGSTELAANLFRATQTEDKLRREGITGRDAANATHHAVGRAVRKTIEELGGAMPEDLPTPPESVRQVERRERVRIERDARRDAQARKQPSLFAPATDGDDSRE